MIFLASWTLCAGPVPAQFFDASTGDPFSSVGQGGIIRGRIESQGAPYGRLSVVLREPGGGRTSSRADVRSTGDFELVMSNPPDGLYELTVVDATSGAVIHREHVSCTPGQGWLNITLPKPKTEQPASGWVTMEQLREKPPKKAHKELQRSQRALARNDFQQAQMHLDKALEIYPTYIDAQHTRGLVYLKQQKYEQARQSFARALELDPNRASSNYSIGLALAALGRFEEAERAARAAVRLAPGMPWSHYVLGIVLMKRRPNEAETTDQLRQAAPAIPIARIALAEVLVQQGKRGEAAAELESYLDSGAKDNRSWAEEWMKKLRAQ